MKTHLLEESVGLSAWTYRRMFFRASAGWEDCNRETLDSREVVARLNSTLDHAAYENCHPMVIRCAYPPPVGLTFRSCRNRLGERG